MSRHSSLFFKPMAGRAPSRAFQSPYLRRGRRGWSDRLFHLFHGRTGGVLCFFVRLLRGVLGFVSHLVQLGLRLFRGFLCFFELLIGRVLCLFRLGLDRLFGLFGLLFEVVTRLFVAARQREQCNDHRRQRN